MTYIKTGDNNKLDVILADKEAELVLAKQIVSDESMMAQAINLKRSDVRNFCKALSDNKTMSVIAEIKKASPSLGNINTTVSIAHQAKIYESGGAQAISVLTNTHFKGNLSDIRAIREVTTVPLLRKDFIFDPYQVYESYCAGADALLLIATILDSSTLKKLISLTHKLGMECLVETHTTDDLKKALDTDAKIIGINARNLKTFALDIKNITNLAPLIPNGRYVVAESGIRTKEDVEIVAESGCDAVLVGTTLMQSDDIPAQISEFRRVERSKT